MINLTLVYYGNFPNYFQLYLDSLEANDDILKILLITDINMDEYKIQKNIVLQYLTFDNVKIRLMKFIKYEYDLTVNTEEILKKPYKLCDLRPIYPILFSDFYDNFIQSENDYIGYCDCDVIMGKLSNFVNLNIDYNLI